MRLRPGAFVGAVALLALGGCSIHEAFDTLTPKDPGVRLAARDRAYGSDPRQRLDVWTPRRGAGPAPVLVFIYGGSWSSGSKDDYDFAGSAFASQGFVTVVADYRLYPNVYPTFLDDGAAAIRWAREHAREFGGDPDRLVLAGHSAGAYNVAMLALDQGRLARVGVPREALRGWAGLAGPYDFLPLDDDATIRSFGRVPSDELPSTQPINFVDPQDPAAFLATGADDETVAPRHTFDLAKRLEAAGVPVQTKVYPKTGHVGLAVALSRPFRGRAPVLADAAAFLRRVAAAPQSQARGASPRERSAAQIAFSRRSNSATRPSSARTRGAGPDE